ncbi:MAG: HMA2 domain-containing protein [Prochloraceae cyanobacterium]
MTTTTTANNNSLNTEKIETQIAEFLQEHQEIETILPVVIGIFVTTRFQLRGSNALLANLIIASAIRQILTNVKKIAPQKEAEVNNKAASQELFGAVIVHNIPGRIRLQIPRLANDLEYAEGLNNLLLADENVISVRINRAASSIAINYETREVSELELGLRLRSIIEKAEDREEKIVNSEAN